jgi:hypothetical protein
MSDCKLCEFEEGWGKPFCQACGTIFDAVPILERVKEYVAGVNADFAEDKERDQTLAMLDALIQQTKPVSHFGVVSRIEKDQATA